MPFAVATVALISTELLSVPAGRAGPAAAATASRPAQRAAVAVTSVASPTPDAAQFRLASPSGPPGSTDLAVYLGQRDRGAQFELGALGGGRSDAPGLVHIGLGWDF